MNKMHRRNRVMHGSLLLWCCMCFYIILTRPFSSIFHQFCGKGLTVSLGRMSNGKLGTPWLHDRRVFFFFFCFLLYLQPSADTLRATIFGRSMCNIRRTLYVSPSLGTSLKCNRRRVHYVSLSSGTLRGHFMCNPRRALYAPHSSGTLCATFV